MKWADFVGSAVFKYADKGYETDAFIYHGDTKKFQKIDYHTYRGDRRLRYFYCDAADKVYSEDTVERYADAGNPIFREVLAQIIAHKMGVE